MSEQTAITVQDNSAAIMPVASVDMMLERYRTIVQIKDEVMRKDVDYGVIPGTGDKPTLLKPGAEKLCTVFGLVPEFEELEHADLAGLMAGDTAAVPLIIYRYRCTLKSRDGRFTVGQGVGSCNSWEKKYRYRTVYGNKATDEEKAAAIRKETRKGQFGPYEVYVLPNQNIADVINTLDKMAQKRALVAATLIAVGASDFFTQDIEDLREVITAEVVEVKQDAAGNGDKPAATAPAVEEKHWTETQDWSKFWPYWKEQGLDNDDVHDALDVESMKDYTGSKKECFEALHEYAAAKAENEPEQSELDAFFEEPTWNPDKKTAFFKLLGSLPAATLYEKAGCKNRAEFFLAYTPDTAAALLEELKDAA